MSSCELTLTSLQTECWRLMARLANIEKSIMTSGRDLSKLMNKNMTNVFEADDYIRESIDAMWQSENDGAHESVGHEDHCFYEATLEFCQ